MNMSDASDGGEGLQIRPVTLPEAVQFNGILLMHSACEGASENVKFRWD